MLTGPIPATAKVLKKAGLALKDIDLFECNEAFASVVLAWMKETGVDPSRVNVNGGAVALGHPLGATGARLVTTILHELERRRLRLGLVTLCIGMGQGMALILERLA
jgi:acetyl-CoA acetyltransferase